MSMHAKEEPAEGAQQVSVWMGSHDQYHLLDALGGPLRGRIAVDGGWEHTISVTARSIVCNC